MRIKSRDRRHFQGSHKGCDIEIERELDGRFYIIVTHSDGGHLYNGWAPEGVRTMAAAKREALYGSCLAPRPEGVA